MAGARGYHSYRGRASRGKIALAAVLVLVILVSVGFLFAQQYVVYDEEGRSHLELPWTREEEQESPEQEVEDVELTIEPAGPGDTVLVTHQMAQAPLTQAALTAAAEAECDALAVTVKDRSGTVYYDSAAAQSGTVTTAADTAAALAALTEQTRAVARLSCLLDPTAARADVEGKGLKNTGGYIFYDGNNLNWLDPAKEGTKTYLGALAVECAELGFDEILLTDLSYPTVGKIDKIAYTADDLAASLAELVRSIRTALDEAGHGETVLSLELPAAVITAGEDAVAGVKLAELAPLVNAVYAETEESGTAALAAAVEAAGSTFVPELAVPPQSWEGSWLLTA